MHSKFHAWKSSDSCGRTLDSTTACGEKRLKPTPHTIFPTEKGHAGAICPTGANLCVSYQCTWLPQWQLFESLSQKLNPLKSRISLQYEIYSLDIQSQKS